MAVFTPVEEAQSNLVAAWEQVERVAKDFFRVGWVDGPCITISTVDLGEGLVLTELEEALEVAEGTLVEAAEIMNLTPVEEGEGLITMEQISRMDVVTEHLATAR